MNRQESISIAGLSPSFVAASDYRMGGGQDENPYEPGSTEYRAYAWEMHRLWGDEFHADQEQAKHGGTPA